MKIYCQTGEIVKIPFNSLVRADLNGLKLHRAILEGVDMSYSSCVKTDLRGALLVKTNLTKANLTKSSLITAFLMEAIMESTNMKGCRSMACYFNKANLKNADLNMANVSYADFSECNLQGSIMTCLGIESAIFKGAFYDDFTLWPKLFDPISAGCIKV